MTSKSEIPSYDWNLRLSKHVDHAIVLFFWLISIFNLIATYFVYSIFPSYDLYNTNMSAFDKVVHYTTILLPICLLVTIALLGDRYLALRNTKEMNNNKPNPVAINISFKKRNMVRFFVAATVSFFSLPWILAIVGIYISDVPLLSIIFLGRQPYPSPDGLPSVHLGTHHGWDAYLFTIFALVGSISLDSNYYLKNKALRSVIAGGIVFLLGYGFFGGFEDGINEQLLKRGLEVPIYAFFRDVYYSAFFYPGLAIAAISFGLIWFLFIDARI